LKPLDERDWLLARVAEKLDLALEALLGELVAHGMVVCRNTLWRFLRREGISSKKKSCTPPSRIGLTLHGGACGDAAFNRVSMPSVWSSSMRRGPRRKRHLWTAAVVACARGWDRVAWCPYARG
jgi:hypothetical protein